MTTLQEYLETFWEKNKSTILTITGYSILVIVPLLFADADKILALECPELCKTVVLRCLLLLGILLLAAMSLLTYIVLRFLKLRKLEIQQQKLDDEKWNDIPEAFMKIVNEMKTHK